jgi:hypothetical protein
VRKNLLGYHFSHALQEASRLLDQGQAVQAAALLAEVQLRIERERWRNAELNDDPELRRDTTMLAAYQRVLSESDSWLSIETIRQHLVYSLAYAGKVKLPPGAAH